MPICKKNAETARRNATALRNASLVPAPLFHGRRRNAVSGLSSHEMNTLNKFMRAEDMLDGEDETYYMYTSGDEGGGGEVTPRPRSPASPVIWNGIYNDRFDMGETEAAGAGKEGGENGKGKEKEFEHDEGEQFYMGPPPPFLELPVLSPFTLCFSNASSDETFIFSANQILHNSSQATANANNPHLSRLQRRGAVHHLDNPYLSQHHRQEATHPITLAPLKVPAQSAMLSDQGKGGAGRVAKKVEWGLGGDEDA